MRFPRLSLFPASCILVLAGMMAATAWACSVPVFRYALEHWEADPFQAVVFHQGELSAEQKARMKALVPDGADGRRANLSVVAVNVDEEPGAGFKALWSQLPKDAPMPQVVLRFPRSSGLSEPFLTAPLDDMDHVADSPARQEVAERFSQGQSAVWVMVDSGDDTADEAAAKVLEERLEYLMGVLTLPELEAQDIANGLVSVGQDDLRLEFSVLRVSRDDVKEKVFVQMLLATEPGLDEVDEPMVFPIFGRGRVLYALVGQGIKAETIEEAAAFLIGKCSCQVKDQNPGTDLLLTANWTAMAQASPQLPRVAHLAEEAAPVTVTTEPVAVESVAAGQGALVSGGMSLAILLVTILVAVKLLGKRRQ